LVRTGRGLERTGRMGGDRRDQVLRATGYLVDRSYSPVNQSQPQSCSKAL
jgi:hypothetical protein